LGDGLLGLPSSKQASLKADLNYRSGVDINFTCGFDEDDFNELPDERVEVPQLVPPQRELRVHSNNLKEVSLR